MKTIGVIDIVEDFCPDFAVHKAAADAAEYSDMQYGNMTYPGFSLQMTRWAYDRFAEILGFPVKPCLDYFRKYERGMHQDTFVHSDKGISKYTAVLSLRNDNGALVFWNHKNGEDRPLLGVDYTQEGLDEAFWNMTHKIDLKENLCVIYPAELFHSRYPKDWDQDYARHIQVFFFNPVSKENFK